MKYFTTIILFCTVFLSIETYGQLPQTNNLISYYPFLGNLEDQSASNHDTGVANGNPSLTQNRFGTSNAAYYLDGTDDYLYFGNSIYADLPDTDSDGYYEDDYTISIWAKSSVVDNENFLAFGEAAGLYTGMISIIGTNISFNSFNWGFTETSTAGRKYDNNWHQYTFVYEAGSFRKLFIDGSLVRQANDSQPRFRFKNYGLSVGVGRFDASGNPEGLTTTYTGSVDDVRIWNVALTNTEVSNLYTYENNAANDFSLPPIITGPSSASGLNSTISINENIAAVHTFSANESVTWSLGNTNDEALFTIDSSGNLVFTTAPDFETPASTLNSNTYVVDVVATDTSNNATTQTISITILDVANTTFGTFASITEEYFTGTHTIVAPTSNNSNPIVYSSDNTAVATVSGSIITFTGVGTATISATQSTDASFEGGSVSAVLTVLGKDLVSKYGGISSTDTNYVDANGKVGGNNGIGKYGDKNQVKPLQNSLRLTASNSEYLTFPKAVGLNASADFTFETWIKFNSIGTYQMDPIFGGGQADYISIYGGYFAARINVNNPCTADRNFFSYSLITTNVWHHIALVRSGSTITAYLDGVAKGTTSCTGVFMNSLSTVYIGKNTWRSGFLNADISNMRYVVGTALYTSNFTPPTTVLTAIPGTQFLFLANNVSNPLKDSSVNNLTVTPFGSPTLIIGNGPF
jgi:hypothetical protein